MPRDKKLNKKMRDERREQIVSVSLALFAEKGFSATKISDITIRAGISQGLFYHYYKSKDAIFTELVGNAFFKLNEACRSLETFEIPPEEKIATAIDHLVRLMWDNEESALYHLFVAQATVSSAIPHEAKNILEKENKVPYEIIGRIMREGQKTGSIRDGNVEHLTRLFWTSISGLAISATVHRGEFDMPDPDILKRMFLKT